MDPALVIHADHLLRGDEPPVVDGALVLDGDGAVIEAGPAAELIPRHAGASIERVRGVVLPGLVNAHTHLELSALRGRVPGGRGFVAWVEHLIGARTELPEEDAEAAVASAVDALVSSGTVAVGEVTNGLGAVGALARAAVQGCVFHEVFGLDRDSVLRRLGGLSADVTARASRWGTDGGELPGGLSYAPAPHTLYTTHPDAVRAILASAAERGARTSLHLAEHAPERSAIERGEGPVVPWLRERARVTREWPLTPLFDHAAELGALSPTVLLVHLADARADELDRVRAAGSPVVLCPRSNLHIDVRLPPLVAMRAAGIEPALGTDSLASSPSLDVLAEARALRDRFSSVPAWELVRMATWNGARALGLPALGRFAPGARPGVFAVEGDAAARAPDGAAYLLSNLGAPRRRIRGAS
jgi:aminodeoxyfutalosine deaminase